MIEAVEAAYMKSALWGFQIQNCQIYYYMQVAQNKYNNNNIRTVLMQHSYPYKDIFTEQLPVWVNKKNVIRKKFFLNISSKC